MMRAILNIGVQAIRSGSRVLLQSLDRLDSLKNEPNKRLEAMQSLLENVVYSMHQVIYKAHPKHEIQWQGESDKLPKQPLWLLQPMAGLNNFQNDIPHYALSITHLIDQHAQVAIIYDPLRDEMYSATLGQGAYMNQRRIRARKAHDLKSALIATNDVTAINHSIQTQRIRQSGCTSLDLAYVAHGRIPAFIGNELKNEHAGLLMVKESGAIHKSKLESGGQTINCIAASGLIELLSQ